MIDVYTQCETEYSKVSRLATGTMTIEIRTESDIKTFTGRFSIKNIEFVPLPSGSSSVKFGVHFAAEENAG